MALKWLVKADLTAHQFERFIDESSKDDELALENLEWQNIGLIKSKLSGRYDTEQIFDGIGEMEIGGDFVITERPAIIVMILTWLVLYMLVRRNAARKVPSDWVKNYEMAIKWLDEAQMGIVSSPELPLLDDKYLLYHGSSKNENWYL